MGTKATEQLSTTEAADRFGVLSQTIRKHCKPGWKLSAFAKRLSSGWVLTVPQGAGDEWYRATVGPRRGRAGNRRED